MCFPWRCLHTTDDSHSELLRAAHRFDLAWYERIDVNGSDHVIQCKMSSSGSLRDSWKPIGEFVRVTRVDFSYVPLALSLPTYSSVCILKMLGCIFKMAATPGCLFLLCSHTFMYSLASVCIACVSYWRDFGTRRPFWLSGCLLFPCSTSLRDRCCRGS